MSKPIPTVQKFMTYNPYSINDDAAITEAVNLMEDKKIRHIPVMKENKIFGILSDRDIKLALSIADTDPENIKVGDICHAHLYQVAPDAPLNQVANEMAEHHYGCAVVLQNNKLVGIFTAVDACRALATILEQRKN